MNNLLTIIIVLIVGYALYQRFKFGKKLKVLKEKNIKLIEAIQANIETINELEKKREKINETKSKTPNDVYRRYDNLNG